MGFLSGLFRTRDAPQNRTVGSNYAFYLGGSTSGKMVNERSAMQMTAVYACVRILAEAIAGLPLHLYKYTDEGGKEKAMDHPLYLLLHDEPNPEMSSFVFRETLMTHLLLWGNAYAQIIRNGKGEVIALYPLMPNRMTVDRDENGHLYYQYSRSNDEAIKSEDSTVILQPKDVLHIPGLGFDGLVGYSPIAMAKNAIGLAIATEEYGAKFFANGAAPSGVLEHPGTIKDPSKVREAWQSQFGGSQNSGKVAVLEEGMKYTPISISPEQAQFLETRKFQINEIARIFRVPPHMVGDLEKSSFSNIEQQSLEFVKYTLDPWVVRWEQAISRALLTPDEKKRYFVKFNLEGLLRGDYQSRMQGYATARQNGWMSANDIRELENLDLIAPEDGGDLYLVNGNMVPLTLAGVAYVVQYANYVPATYAWKPGQTVLFIYDGSYYVAMYTATATTGYYGVTRLYGGVDSTNTTLAATASAAKTAYDRNSWDSISLTNPLALAYGGTGATSAAAARSNLGIYATCLYSGAITTGSAAFMYSGYKFFIIIGQLSSTGSRSAIVVPASLITTASTPYQLADESYYYSFNLYYSGSYGYLVYKGRNSSGQILYIYGVN